tara:strand:- start:2009 stop:3559 length:1551 start_codon:yes stop_codon:yes gene_type:complete
MALGLKGEIALTVRDRRTGESHHHKQVNAISYYNFVGNTAVHGLFKVISTGSDSTNISVTPNKLILEMSPDHNSLQTTTDTYSLVGHLNTSSVAPNSYLAGREVHWGDDTNGSLRALAYPLKATVNGATITYSLREKTTTSWADGTFNSGYDDTTTMVPVPEKYTPSNPLGRRVVQAIRLNGEATPVNDNTTYTSKGLGLAADEKDLASVDGNDLPADLASTVPIHNFSDIGLSYSITVADTTPSVEFGGFTDAYLNRLARFIAMDYTSSSTITSNTSYGSGRYRDSDDAETNSMGVQITSAAVFGAMTPIGASFNDGLPTASSGATATIEDVSLSSSTWSQLQAGEKTFWLDPGSSSVNYEKVYVTNVSTLSDGKADISFIRGVDCTTPQAVSENTTVHFSTMSRLAFSLGGQTKWGDGAGSTTGKNYYDENGAVDTSVTPWEMDFGTLLVEPKMIEYYTHNKDDNWDVTANNYYQDNLDLGREIAARFPINLSSSFTANDKVKVNNFLGLKIGT